MRTKKGIITAAKMTGTVTVTVHRHLFHALYKKRFRKSTKFLADTAGFTDLQVGDTVVIAECAPISKRKHFRISDVVERGPRVSELKEEAALETALRSKQKKEKADDSPSKA